MKRFWFVLLLTAACFSTMSAVAQDRQGGGRQMPSVDDQVADIKKAVNLSDDQTSKVHDILQAQRDKAQQMMQESSVSREDRRAKMQGLRQDSNDQIKALLSDDQKKSYEKYLQDRQNRWGNRQRDDHNESPQ